MGKVEIISKFKKKIKIFI